MKRVASCHGKPVKRIVYILGLLLLCGMMNPLGLFAPAVYSEPNATIYQLPVQGTIDLGLTAFLRRGISLAREQNAHAIVFTINTFGGRVDAADEIVSAMRDYSPLPTFAYITDSAWSAGALIGLASPNIIMRQGSSIGSAEPRLMGFGQREETIDEKMLSSLRAKFKATAQANGHPILIAEAMVDKDIEVVQANVNGELLLLTREQLEQRRGLPDTVIKDEAVISAQGKLLNLTAQEAGALQLAVAVVDSDAECYELVAQRIGMPSANQLHIVTLTPTWSENMVRFLTHPIISSLLLSLGFLGLLFELRMPGWGISGTLGALFLILFFWGHYLAGLANWVDIAIVLVGVGFILLELTTPGFGIFGMTGIVLTLAGLMLTMIRHPLTIPNLQFDNALRVITYSGLMVLACFVLGLRLIPRTSLWKRLTLEASEQKEAGFQVSSPPAILTLGMTGIAKTILRPTGKAEFDSLVSEVMSSGAFIPAGARVKIVRIEGNAVIVEQTRET